MISLSKERKEKGANGASTGSIDIAESVQAGLGTMERPSRG